MKKKILGLTVGAILLSGGISAFAGSITGSIHINQTSSTSPSASITVNSVVTTTATCDASSNKSLDAKLKRGAVIVQNLQASKGKTDYEQSTIQKTGDHHLRLDPGFTVGSGAKGSATSNW